MIRSELVVRVSAQNPHLFLTEAEAVVDAILGRIEAALIAGDRVELRDFGAFSMRVHAARVGRNPRTGAPVEVAAKTSIHFKPGKAMRTALIETKPAATLR